jgi:hypothetical protein
VSWVASLLLAQAVAAAPPPAEADNEIVVLGQRLAETRADWSTRLRGGAMTIRRCKITHSSGDRQLDKVVCKALRECAPRIPADATTGDPMPEFYACAQERSMAMGRALLERGEKRR